MEDEEEAARRKRSGSPLPLPPVPLPQRQGMADGHWASVFGGDFADLVEREKRDAGPDFVPAGGSVPFIRKKRGALGIVRNPTIAGGFRVRPEPTGSLRTCTSPGNLFIS